jgi:hypothetical protein
MQIQGYWKKLQLEKWPIFLLQSFVVQLLKQKKSPLFREIHMPGGPLYARLRCFHRRRIGLDQVLAFIAAWEDPLPRAAFILSTSGFTQEAIDFVKDMHIPLLLLDLEQLTLHQPSDLQIPLVIPPQMHPHNIHFLP